MGEDNKRKAETGADSHQAKEAKHDGETHDNAGPDVQLGPYLYFNGNCQEAIDFYVEALGAKIDMLTRFGDGPDGGPDEASKNLVMHCSLSIDGVSIMFSDYSEGMCGNIPFKQGNNVHLSFYFKDHARERKVFAALSEGGIVTMPLANQFWNSYFGTLTDKFGVHWMLSGPPATTETEETH
eukprot:gene34207-41407_t